ncbi:MAG: hypothetical protein K0R39_2404 [Symbiobacteriaceae bacterium]|jgi:uncharacterized membrane protein YciS (DUF1049 family)|nr:hypothetical protein [Symbiobacteriaceae bacterium]
MEQWVDRVFEAARLDSNTQLAVVALLIIFWLAWQIVSKASAQVNIRTASMQARLLEFYSPAYELLWLKVQRKVSEERFREGFADLLIRSGGHRHLDDDQARELHSVISAFRSGDNFDELAALAIFESEVNRLSAEITISAQPVVHFIKSVSWLLSTVVVSGAVGYVLLGVLAALYLMYQAALSSQTIGLSLFVLTLIVAGIITGMMYLRVRNRRRRLAKRTEELRLLLDQRNAELSAVADGTSSITPGSTLKVNAGRGNEGARTDGKRVRKRR